MYFNYFSKTQYKNPEETNISSADLIMIINMETSFVMFF